VSERRGVVIPVVAAALAFAILIGLGLWQLDRKVWKETLIAAMDERLAAAPAEMPLPDAWNALRPDNAEFRRVRFTADFLPVKDTYAYVAGSALRNDIKIPGYFVFRPARLANGKIVVVNRGYVPIDHTAQSASGPQEVTGYIRFPEKGTPFTSASDGEGDVWFVRDQRAMAAKRGWGEVAPFYIDQETPVPAGGLPRPSALIVNLRNDHFGYALTWFGLAATLVGVFIAWLVSRRRQPVA